MKIVIFAKNTTFNKYYGGMETQNKILSEALASMGHDVTVIAPNRDLNIFEKKEGGVKYLFVKCDFPKFNLVTSFFYNTWFKASLNFFREYYSNNKVDLIVSQSTAALEIIRHKNEFESVPLVGISHGTKISEVKSIVSKINSIKSLLRFAITVPHILNAFFNTQRLYAHGCNRIICVSNYMKNQLIEETYVPEDKIIVIPNGIPVPEDVVKKSFKGKKLNFLYIGRIIEEKGVFDLVKVFKDLLQDENFAANTSLTFVGNGPDLEKLKQLTSFNSNYFNVVGGVDSTEVGSYYNSHQVLLFNTKRIEGFPMILPEALHYGLIVLATDIGGNKDALNDSGILVPAGDLELFKKEIKSLFALQPSELLKKSEHNVKIAKNKFTDIAMAKQYESLFKKVL
jgi:glycosyltransferase involved in cell wall biosynthesis